MVNTKQLYDYVDAAWQDSIIPSLCDYIKIPNKSPHFDSDWENHGYMEQAVAHVATWCQANAPHAMKLEILRIPQRTPLLFMEIPGTVDETIVLYGHLDKQPEMTGWNTGLGPWTPVLKDGRLYGRGAADDGYAAYAALTAIRALQAQGLPHARCVVIIEACEESGSYDLPYYLELVKERIGVPNLIICLDSGAGNFEQLWLTTSLRGNVVGHLSVELLSEGVHSGLASGIVADSFRVARQLISRLEAEETGEIKLPALHCTIPEIRVKEAKSCAQIVSEQLYHDLPLHPGVKPVVTDVQELILNRTWRPTLTVTGAEGFPSVQDAGNVLRPKTAFKLSLRIPPLVSPEDAAKALTEALTKNPPYQAKVDFKLDSASPGWQAPVMSAWLSDAVEKASSHFFQKPAVYFGEGGTIPFLGMLGSKFPNAEFVVTGVLGPHANAHGPNEFLQLAMGKKITCCVSYIISQHSQVKR